MDTQLYKWKEENQQINKQDDDNNIIIQDQVLQENQIVPLENAIDKKRARVRKNMPEGIGVFSQKQNLIRTGKYRFIDSSGNAHDAKRTTPSSKYMKPVLNALKTIDEKLSRRYDPFQEEDIHLSFLDAIQACENYLDNRNPWTAEGKARRQMVQDFYAQLREESMKLENRVAQMKAKGEQPVVDNNIENAIVVEESLTWYDLLKDVRTAKFKDGEDGVKISKGGAGTSDVYIVEKNGQKKYFKENEKTSQGNFFNMMDESAVHLDNEAKETEDKEQDILFKNRAELLRSVNKGLKVVFGNDEKRVMRFLKGLVSGEEFILALKDEETMPEDVRQIFLRLTQEFVSLNQELDELRSQVAQMGGQESSEEYKSLMARAEQKLKEVEECDYAFIAKEISRLQKAAFSDIIAGGISKIESGEELSKRNVATSRLAKILGIGNLIAKSELATVTINGKTMTGSIMDQAKGADTSRVIKNNQFKKKTVKYTGNAFKELTSLQVFDIICGQVDRHSGNYLATTEEKDGVVYLQSFQGIDNDMSFGLLTYKDILDTKMNGYKRIRNIENDGKMVLPFIDLELAMKIKALDVNILEYQMADILSKKERKALTARIKSVKKVIEKQLAYEEKLRSKGVKFNSRFVNSKTDRRAWDKAMQIYNQKMDKLKQKNPDYAKGYIEGTTYLWGNVVLG